MSGIYIHGMEMPHNGEIVLVYPDGNAALFARMDVNILDFALKNRKAIPVPDHGRLIDADAVISFVDCGHLQNPLVMSWSDNDVVDMIESRPTIIPADGKDGADGQTPHIGENGNWWIGDTDTGVKAAGDDGKDGAIVAATAIGSTALISNIILIALALVKKKKLF